MATPSPSGRESAVVERLCSLLADVPVRTDVDGVGNLIAARGEGPMRMVVLGHLDTVPELIPTSIDDEWLHGRGAVDAKGPLCAALAALATVDDGRLDGLSVTVVGAVGEEAPGSIGARHVAATIDPPDVLVIAEPSGVDGIVLGYRGQVRMRVRTTDATEHAAGPRPSSADRLVDVLAEARRNVARLTEEPDAEDAQANWRTRTFDALKITVLDMRVTRTSDVEFADAWIQVRLPPTWSPARFTAWWERQTWSREIGTEWGEAVPAVRSPSDTPLHRAFRAAIRSVRRTPRHTVKTGTSDWNVVESSWNVPTLAYGPGDASLDHTPHERLSWNEYERAIDVWHHVIGHLSRRRMADGSHGST